MKATKMNDPRKQKLINLGAGALADALLELAIHSENADDIIESLVATPSENVQRFKKKIASLKRSRRFIDWQNSSGLAQELRMLLQSLKISVSNSLTGAELVARFFETDDGVLGHCDDSYGLLGDVYRHDAKELFVEFASQCVEKEKISSLILKLNRKDDYGVRDSIVNCVSEFLPEPLIRSMVPVIQKRADNESDQYKKRHHLLLIELLARELGDPELFEKTRIASWGKLSSAAFVDISRVCLESGDSETAYEWLMKIPEDETFQAYERNKLLKEIFRKQNNIEKLTQLLYSEFNAYHSESSLQALLDVIGQDHRDEIVAKEVASILNNSKLKESDAAFLLSLGKIDEAEIYLLGRTDFLTGDRYESLLPLAESMEAENRNLTASLLFRSLLISILERAYTKAYAHGVKYLCKLDQLAETITDWKAFDNHAVFKAEIHQAHGRKRSFWSKYEMKK